MHGYAFEVDTDKPLTWGNKNFGVPREFLFRSEESLKDFLDQVIKDFVLDPEHPHFKSEAMQYQTDDIIVLIHNKRMREVSWYNRAGIAQGHPDCYEACRMVAAFDRREGKWLQRAQDSWDERSGKWELNWVELVREEDDA